MNIQSLSSAPYVGASEGWFGNRRYNSFVMYLVNLSRSALPEDGFASPTI
jgi:hypothetical protein